MIDMRRIGLTPRDRRILEILSKYVSVKEASNKENIPRSTIDNWTARQRNYQADARIYLNQMLGFRNRGGLFAKVLKPRRRTPKVPDENNGEEDN